jgi:hypothetical protein
MTPSAVLLFSALTLGLPAAQAQKGAKAKDDPTAADLVAVNQWLGDYRGGLFRLAKDGQDDAEAVATVEKLFAAIARWNNMAAATKLLECAMATPVQPGNPGPTEQMAFRRETQPWRVQGLARKYLATITDPGLESWLAAKANLRGRSFKDQPALERETALRVLAARGSLRGTVTILQACKSYPPAERVRAVDILGQHASLETVPSFLPLLSDREPNVRIAALNGIARALGPHSDETRAEPVAEEAAHLRDAAITAIKPLLEKDRVWQVRAAAREALFALRSKHVIPVLIAGLAAELKRQKDPWSLDIRLHDALERMTGQEVPPGSVEFWEKFWAEEGPRFEYARAQSEAQARTQARAGGDSRYRKFFKLSIDSDRMLFVVDFSGSMLEAAGAKGTAAQGHELTKHRLVIEELKRIIMGLPAGTGFNLIAFAHDVKVWRGDERGCPLVVTIDDQLRDELVGKYLDALQPNGPTNLWGALDAALDLGGRGLFDGSKPTFDTIYVLSDGTPSWGDVVDTDEILRRVRETNALRRVVINTITFGEKNEVDFLRKLAEENGGRHQHVD